MYNLTRIEASEKLGVSTRSIDRYIKAGKIRSKKKGKIVYVNNSDIENLVSGGKKQEVIIKKSQKKEKKSPILEESEVFKKQETYEKEVVVGETRVNTISSKDSLDNIYADLKFEIKKKDDFINELSIRLGRAEEIAKNSVNILDYKKSQFLLEESRNHLNNEIDDLKIEKIDLEKKLRYEKTSNIILIFIVIILFVVSGIIWFLEI